MKVRNLSSSVLEVLGLIIGYFYFIAFVVLAAVSGGVLFTKVYTNRKLYLNKNFQKDQTIEMRISFAAFVSLIPFVLCSFCVSVCYVSYEFIAGIKTVSHNETSAWRRWHFERIFHFYHQRDRERLLPFIDVAIVCFIALVFAAVIYGFHGVPVHLCKALQK